MGDFVKKIAALVMVIALLGMFGCGERAPEWFSPPGTTPEGETVPWPDAIPLSELDPILGPGPFSLDELAQRFGEPAGLSASPAAGWIVTLNVSYEGFWFDLILDTDQPFYDIDLKQVDRALPMEVYQTTVMGGEFPMPRGIRLGDSYEAVRAAYPETPHRGHGLDDGAAELFYRYEGAAPGEYGIWYYFENDRLNYATIKWLDLYA
jgi:hypothetical protein